jgi:hypothetical protein
VFLAVTGAAAAGLGLTDAAKATRAAVPRDLRTWLGVRREFVLRTPARLSAGREPPFAMAASMRSASGSNASSGS